MIIIIPTADDSRDTLKTEIDYKTTYDGGENNPSWERTNTNRVNVSYTTVRGLDRIHQGLCTFWSNRIKDDFDSGAVLIDIVISGYGIIITKDRNYKMNGQSQSKVNISNVLSRLTYASVNDKDRSSIRDKYAMYCKTPNDVIYALENRTPYHWYEAGVKIDVRLNTKKISDTELSLEISDGLWGAITTKNLNSFLSFYLHNRKQSKWKFMSPTKLYSELMGREPSESELELMVAVIVEERAKELLVSMSKQYSDRMYMTKIEELIHIRVRGKLYDWLLVENRGFSESSTQKVAVYVLGADFVSSHDETTQEEIDSGGVSTVTNYVDSKWRGPICIDNMASGSSLGDQFASRIFAVMNDSMTVSRVSTLSHYLDNTYPPAKISLVEGLYADDDDTHYQSFTYSHRRLHSKSTTIVTTTMEIEEEFK